MSRNFIRRSNDIQVHRLWRWVAVILVVTVFCLVFVFLQNRNIQLANDVKKLEVELSELSRRNNTLHLEVEHRMKPRALQAKIAEFKLELVNVSDLPKVKAPAMLGSPAYSYAQKEDGR